MLVLPTTLLKHTTRQGSHYDWLLANPRDPDGLLITFRVQHPSSQWASIRNWALEPIAPHRRVYLAYEGPISGGRGQVSRVDEGTFTPRLWTASRAIIDLRLKQCEGTIELRRVSTARWLANLVGSLAAHSTDDDGLDVSFAVK